MTTTTTDHEPVTAADLEEVARIREAHAINKGSPIGIIGREINAHVGNLLAIVDRLARDLAAARETIDEQATAIANTEEERDAHGILADKLELQLNCPAHDIPRRVEALLRLARVRGAAVARLRVEVARLADLKNRLILPAAAQPAQGASLEAAIRDMREAISNPPDGDDSAWKRALRAALDAIVRAVDASRPALPPNQWRGDAMTTPNSPDIGMVLCEPNVDPRWLVFIHREGGQRPTTIGVFKEEESARHFYTLHGSQWSGAYLCKVVLPNNGGDTARPAPALTPEVDTWAAVKEAWAMVLKHSVSGPSRRAPMSFVAILERAIEAHDVAMASRPALTAERARAVAEPALAKVIGAGPAAYALKTVVGLLQRAAAGEFGEGQSVLDKIAEIVGRMHEADGHNPVRASDAVLIERIEELARIERDLPISTATLGTARPALSEERARITSEIEDLLESVESVSTHGPHGWTLPDGQNAIVKSDTGHLSVLHTSVLRSWVVQLREILTASRGDDGAPGAERTPETVLRAMLLAYEKAALDEITEWERTDSPRRYEAGTHGEGIAQLRARLAMLRGRGAPPEQGLSPAVRSDYEARLSGARPLNAPPFEGADK